MYLIGDIGRIDDAKLISSSSNYSRNATNCFESQPDIILSINKSKDYTLLNISGIDSDKSKKVAVFKAIFNKFGQMIEGSLPLEKVVFKRTGVNIRKITYQKETFSPLAENDKVWECLGKKFSINNYNKTKDVPKSDQEYIQDGIFELFIEFAREYTSIFK